MSPLKPFPVKRRNEFPQPGAPTAPPLDPAQDVPQFSQPAKDPSSVSSDAVSEVIAKLDGLSDEELMELIALITARLGYELDVEEVTAEPTTIEDDFMSI